MTPFGEYLKDKEISVVDAAAALDVTKSYVHMLRNGDVSPSFALAWAIEKWTKGTIVMQSWVPFMGREEKKPVKTSKARKK